MDLNSFNIGTHLAHKGILTISWDKIEGINIEPLNMMNKLIFEAKSEGILEESFSVTSTVTTAEAYDLNDNVMLVKARFEGSEFQDEVSSMRLFENYPNPFSNETIIKFELPEASSVSLNIFDVAGRLVISKTKEFEKGINQMVLTGTELSQSGILYYQVESEYGTQIKKMIKID